MVVVTYMYITFAECVHLSSSIPRDNNLTTFNTVLITRTILVGSPQINEVRTVKPYQYYVYNKFVRTTVIITYTTLFTFFGVL